MDEVKEITIKNIEFDMTSNGNVLTKIYGNDNNVVSFYSGGHYLYTRKDGDNIKYMTTDKGFNNVIIPQQFGELYNSDDAIGKMLRRTYENFRLGLCQVKNGALNKLTKYETENWIDDNFAEFDFFIEKVFERVQKSETPFMKHLSQQIPLKKTSRCCDPEDKIIKLAEKEYDLYRKHNEMIKD